MVDVILSLVNNLLLTTNLHDLCLMEAYNHNLFLLRVLM